MQKNILLISTLFILTACNAPAVTPVVKQTSTEITIASPTAQVIPLAATSTLEIPSPTQQSAQAVIVPTSTPLPPPQTGASNTIKFDAGGTWKDIQDSVTAGSSKVYTLNAMQGQVMSVSITGGYFPLQIQGRDGTALCPVEQNSECSFWRGTLPLSQDYFITVKSGGDQTKFTLRVAINPLGKAEQAFTYNGGNITLTYSDQFAPSSLPSTLNNKTSLQLALQLIDTNSYINTNLGEAYFVLGSSTDSQIIADCTQPNQSGSGFEISNGNVIFNSYNFTSSSSSDAGAGNIYNQYIYRIVNKGVCYEVIYFIHSSNIGNFPPGVVKEFDINTLLQKFNGILSTIQMK